MSGWKYVIAPMSLFLLATIPLPSAGIKGKPCSLDQSWSGDWYEYGERNAIKIDRQNITHKGTCTRKHGDKYIFEDPNLQCYRCAVMHIKHPNVLQYKESLCEPSPPGRRGPFDLCYSITADSPLKSLYRLNATLSKCPIQGSFQFSYSRGHGVCDYPKSSISQCSDASKLVFRYQACADIKGSESIVESVECIAQWKEGSTYYFLGLISRHHVSPYDYEDRFRCFAYSTIHQGYLISQSGDAQCTLHSAKEGDKTMTLKKVHEKQCSLPHWMLQHHHTFNNLNGSVKYHFNTLGTSLTIIQANVTKKLKCSTIEEDINSNLSRIVMQVNFECESGFMCMEVSHKSDSILSLRLGRLSRNPEEACNQHLFFDNSIQPVIIVSAKQGHRESCPLVGKYSFVGNQPNTQSNQCGGLPGNHQNDHVTFGCAGGATEFNVIQNNCNVTQASKSPTKSSSYICYGGWKEPLVESYSSKRSQNTFSSKVQALQSLSSTAKDGGHGHSGTEVGGHYVVISAAETPHKRFCVRLIMDHDNSNVSLWANSQDCPRDRDEGQLWSFNLTRTSECAQALATANHGSKLSKVSPVSQLMLQLLSTSLLILLLPPLNH